MAVEGASDARPLLLGPRPFLQQSIHRSFRRSGRRNSRPHFLVRHQPSSLPRSPQRHPYQLRFQQRGPAMRQHSIRQLRFQLSGRAMRQHRAMMDGRTAARHRSTAAGATAINADLGKTVALIWTASVAGAFSMHGRTTGALSPQRFRQRHRRHHTPPGFPAP